MPRVNLCKDRQFERERRQKIVDLISLYEFKAKLTQEDSAKRVGLSAPTWRGRKRDIGSLTLDELWRAQNVLGIPADDLREIVVIGGKL